GYFIHQLLTKLGCKNGFIGTLGITEIEVISRQTTPDILTLYKALNQYYLLDFHTVILEVSSHALAQNRVAGLNFKQAIFTNLSQDHLDYHQNFKSYQQAKIRLFEFASLKCKIVNSDDENHQVFLGQNGKIQVKYQLADFTKIAPREHGFLCQLDDFVFELPLLGEFNLSNILAAFSSIEQMGFAREAVIPLLPLLSAPIGRMQKIQNSLAWVDFAHTPDALKNAISTLKIHYPEHKIRVVFGCGGNRDQDKRAKMGKIASELASSIILTNDNPRDEPPSAIIDEILSGIDDSYPAEIIPDRQLAIETAITTLAENECLLIAGKGHESTQQFKDKIIQLNDIEIAENATLAQN
ncbi:MAG: UDP-N-acetylmuramoyl-L-alanyl-D-glutamate--2,6-diaminopimelate ligase, partial [Candidatus Thioglobus sp.]|nr:UDP-N-acetylmuramoyl-L-alanyl-D-glutamate--2,6-diaminopimelate ligase [Candidatus Thioglobus sp.]